MSRLSMSLILGLVGPWLAPASQAQLTNRKLSGPFLAQPAPVGFAAFLNEVASPDGARVILLADPDENGRHELYSIASDGSGSLVLLSGALVAGGNIERAAFIPDGTRVVYLADQDVNEVFELYSVLADGSAAPVRISGTLVSGGDVARSGEPFLITPDGARVVYRADQDKDEVVDLYSVPSDGSAAPTRLTDSFRVSKHAIRADGTSAVFLGDTAADFHFELFQVPIDGSAPATKLNGALVADGRVWSFQLTPDGTRALYTAEQGTFGIEDLYSVELDGGSPVKLSGAQFGPATLPWYGSTPDGSLVAFLGNLLPGIQDELWVAPVDGSSPPLLLSAQAISPSLRITQDGLRVAYLAVGSGGELFSVPLDASTAPVRLNAPLQPTGDVSDFQLGPAGRVVYRADQEVDGRSELYSVPADGSAAPVKLNGALLPGGGVQSFELETEGAHVVFRASLGGTANELFSVPIDASAPPAPLTEQVLCNDVVLESRILCAAGRVAYRLDNAGGVEVYSAQIGGELPPVRLFSPPSADTTPGDVLAFELTADGSTAVYLADQDVDERKSLYAVRLRAGEAPLQLDTGPSSPCGDVVSFLLDPTDAFAIYLSDQREDETYELFRASLDGGAEPIPLSGMLATGSDVSTGTGAYAVSPDGAWVVYAADALVDGRFELFSVPLDGSAQPVPLQTGQVVGFTIAPDGARVAFRGGPELFSVPIDGSATPVRLSTPLVYPLVFAFQVGPDGQRVVYSADEDGDSLLDLHSVPIDGSSASILISADLAVGPFEISPDGARVLFRLGHLYSVPIDGSAAPLQLNGNLVAGGSVSDFWLSPDGSRVVYLADEVVNERYDLYSVPVDGSAVRKKLNGSLTTNGDVVYATIAPDSLHVAFVADALGDEVFELFRAPLDGSAPALKLNPPLTIAGDVEHESLPPLIQADGRGVVYVADQRANNVFELFRVAIDGDPAAVKLNATMAGGGDVVAPGFRVSPRGTAVVYAADQESDGVVELFVSARGGPKAALSGLPQPSSSRLR